MYKTIRPILFYFEPERAHKLSLCALKWIPKNCFKHPKSHSITIMGLNFPHPIGLAAGLDKNGEYIDALSKIGFSFIEVGTVTPRPQSGNPKPRLFRLPSVGAIINRMGFNNEGVDALVNNVKKINYSGILGINIGKNTDTPLNSATEDYLHCLERVYAHASYITINISSPNSPDLRQLQQEGYFDQLITRLVEARKYLEAKYKRKVPLVIKLSPDESEEILKRMAELILEKGIDGIIATNTTCHLTNTLSTLPHGNEVGGISGKPLSDRATTCIKLLKEIVGDKVAIIGCGGIDDSNSAKQKINAGASLLQLYTGLIYKGPNLINQLVTGLIE